MIYLSKAMDLFDMTAPALRALAARYQADSSLSTTEDQPTSSPTLLTTPSPSPDLPAFPYPSDPPTLSACRPRSPSDIIPTDNSLPEATQAKNARFIPSSKSPHLKDLAEGLQRLKDIPALVLGVQSDVLFPVEQQRELADALKMAGNDRVTYYELGGVWGHDTFLLDLQNVGGAIRGFLH